MSCVLVTGGAGFIGSHMVDRLLAEDHEVVAVDDLSRGRLENLAGAQHHAGFRFAKADITTPEFGTVVREHAPDTVLHPSRAKAALGWTAGTSLRDGLAATVGWLRETHQR